MRACVRVHIVIQQLTATQCRSFSENVITQITNNIVREIPLPLYEIPQKKRPEIPVTEESILLFMFTCRGDY